MCKKQVLQHDHTSTRKHGRGQVGTELPSTNVHGGRSHQRSSSTLGGGGAVAAAVGSGRGSRDGSEVPVPADPACSIKAEQVPLGLEASCT